MRDSIYLATSAIFNIFSSFLTLILGSHVMFKLIGANMHVPVVSWVHDASNNLSFPFRGLIPDLYIAPSAPLDIVSLITLMIYLIIISIIKNALDTFIAATITESDFDGARVSSHRDFHS